MPDHVHLRLIDQSENADLTRYVKGAKQVTGFAYRQATGQSLWQPGYHERVLRDLQACFSRPEGAGVFLAKGVKVARTPAERRRFACAPRC